MSHMPHKGSSDGPSSSPRHCVSRITMKTRGKLASLSQISEQSCFLLIVGNEAYSQLFSIHKCLSFAIQVFCNRRPGTLLLWIALLGRDLIHAHVQLPVGAMQVMEELYCCWQCCDVACLWHCKAGFLASGDGNVWAFV